MSAARNSGHKRTARRARASAPPFAIDDADRVRALETGLAHGTDRLGAPAARDDVLEKAHALSGREPSRRLAVP